METMKLKNAKPGDRMVDPDGDTWERTAGGAICYFDGPDSYGPPHEWPESDIGEAEERFGPFVPTPAPEAP
jgi:hypothetical protein